MLFKLIILVLFLIFVKKSKTVVRDEMKKIETNAQTTNVKKYRRSTRHMPKNAMSREHANKQYVHTFETDDTTDDEHYFGKVADDTFTLENSEMDYVNENDTLETDDMQMSVVVDEPELFSDNEWHNMVHQAAYKPFKKKQQRKQLQRIMVLSEILAQPKGFD